MKTAPEIIEPQQTRLPSASSSNKQPNKFLSILKGVGGAAASFRSNIFESNSSPSFGTAYARESELLSFVTKKPVAPARPPAEAVSEIADSNFSPEKLLVEVAKESPDYISSDKFQAVSQAIKQLVQNEEADHAAKIINQNWRGAQRDRLLNLVSHSLIESAINSNRFDEARQHINKTEGKTKQISQLVALAVAVYKSGSKDAKANAVKIINEATQTISVPPSDKQETLNFMLIVLGYAAIEPARAFDLLEASASYFNDIIGAAALVAKFNRSFGSFQDDELLINAGLGKIADFRLGKFFGLLATADFDRAQDFAERFAREDTRELLRLLIARSVLTEQSNSIQVSDLVFFNEPIFLPNL